MKKWLIICLVLIIVTFLGFGIYYVVPKTVNQSLKAVEYQLGSNHHQIHNVTIEIKGKEYGTFSFSSGEISRTFIGKIKIKGASYSNPDNNREVKIHLFNRGEGDMAYAFSKNGKSIIHPYGFLFTNRDFSKVAIEELRKGINGKHGWSSKDGWLITGPAKNRGQALEISNELMGKYGFSLK